MTGEGMMQIQVDRSVKVTRITRTRNSVYFSTFTIYDLSILCFMRLPSDFSISLALISMLPVGQGWNFIMHDLSMSKWYYESRFLRKSLF